MEKEITGMDIYYYQVCTRKLWYFRNELQMESEDENVKIGKLLDENSYKRGKHHINIDNVICIDFIKSENILHEVKKSKKIEEASILQLKYYLYYLKMRGVESLTGRIDYPLLKKTKDVVLEDEDIEKLEAIISEIKEIINQELPPKSDKKNICKKCAYFEFCFI
ncbi:MAG: CRISPR-associated protein Cas4 [Clostridioides sp.]|nr:CRISPR-associated protein Cas4 [Clostridioides sp.]